MTRQPGWPENPYPDRSLGDVRGWRERWENGCEAMDTAWREKIEAVYGGPLPLSEYHDDLVGFLKWFVGQLLKEQSNDT